MEKIFNDAEKLVALASEVSFSSGENWFRPQTCTFLTDVFLKQKLLNSSIYIQRRGSFCRQILDQGLAESLKNLRSAILK